MHSSSYLSDQEIRIIWREWQNRPTIKGLADKYGISEELVRSIISLRKEDLPRDTKN